VPHCKRLRIPVFFLGASVLFCTTAIFSRDSVSAVSAVTQSSEDSCAINEGKLYCWGWNGNGEGGLGNKVQYESPQQVGTAVNWTAVSQGSPWNGYSACGIADGALYCWGSNGYGEDGIGDILTHLTPQRVGASTKWSVISHGGADACGIDDGNLYCWGYNDGGEDGVGDTKPHTTPQRVGDLRWTSVSQSGFNACGITSGGALYCWGYNGTGEDGVGDYAVHSTPQQVGSATNWTAVSQGGYDTCGIAGGKLYCWGYNEYGELGLGNTTQYTRPQQVGSAANWMAVSIMNNGEGREADACGIADGKLYCWGENRDGEDGVGNTDQHKTPQQVGHDATWTAVTMSWGDACGIDRDELRCWGKNDGGEDGVGDTKPRLMPQLVRFDGLTSKPPSK
jgi:alpha-tubulin suppressor-like RCC1 family protein